MAQREAERVAELCGLCVPGFSWGHRTTASSTKIRDLLKELDFPRCRRC